MEDSQPQEDEKLPLCFCKSRHVTYSTAGELNFANKDWRIRDKNRMKTISVALVVCLNIGVDPPDVIKIQPCARLECWIDPLSVSNTKALDLIGKTLQAQYERWQPKARYKQSLDPNMEAVKKLCTSLRRNAKEERVLFHYNGHGVPRPTANGEIWVFNESYTQYIPLSIHDLQAWMGAPSIYVYDCSGAGTIVASFLSFAQTREHEMEQTLGSNRTSSDDSISHISYNNCIQLAACGANQILPMNPNIPADLFTSCLTTPIKMALKWYTLQRKSSLVPHISYELIEKIPGQLNDRRTMLGELNWIFTAITDTIAWNILPRDVFQRLFRQDLLVASLFRNFLLAERILRSYDCTPVSHPPLPESHRHPMWDSWDLALDQTLSQLPDIVKSNKPFKNSPFFEEQLRAFEVWLEGCSESRSPPEQLPIVLQVLLSQVHRTRALELLGRFLDLGPWTVNLALSVGIFPYVLKLLQSSAVELKPFLVFIWVKILAVDVACQVDLVKDGYHKYFLQSLQEPRVHRSIFSEDYYINAAFVLASICHKFSHGQENCLQGSLISICLDQLNPGPNHRPNPRLRQWLIICLGNLWQNFERARWSGARDMAHEKLYSFLTDPVPEVRAATVFALGTFISSVTERSDHANNTDRSIAMHLLATVPYDASPIVRMELVATLQWMIIFFENQFLQICFQEASNSTVINHMYTHSLERNINMKRVSSSSSITNQNMTYNPHVTPGSISLRLWTGFQVLCRDPFPEVSRMASQVVQYVNNQVVALYSHKENMQEKQASMSLPPSPNTRVSYLGQSPPVHHHNHIAQRKTSTNDEPDASLLIQSANNRYAMYNSLNTSAPLEFRHARTDSGDRSANQSLTESQTEAPKVRPIVTTKYIVWCVSQFIRQSTSLTPEGDAVDHYDRLTRYKFNQKVRDEGRDERRRAVFNRLDSQCYGCKTLGTPNLVRLHPYESLISVAYKDRIGLQNWTTGMSHSLIPPKMSQLTGRAIVQPLTNMQPAHVTALDFVNEHEDTLILAGYDDGVVRLWRPNKEIGSESPVISAWQALAEPSNKISLNLKTAWDQISQTLYAAGDSKIIRLWDTERELKICDISTGTETAVKELVCNRNGLYAAGCADGSIRLFDRRSPPASARVETYCEYNQSVLSLCLRDDCESLVAASTNGNIRLFDLRARQSVSDWNTFQDVISVGIHSSADILACGSSHNITVFALDGRQLNQIRSQGFIGPKVATTTCLSFHKYKVSLACGFTDNSVTVFNTDKKVYY